MANERRTVVLVELVSCEGGRNRGRRRRDVQWGDDGARWKLCRFRVNDFVLNTFATPFCFFVEFFKFSL